MTDATDYLTALRDADTATLAAIAAQLQAAQEVANTIPALSDEYQIVMFRRDGYQTALDALAQMPPDEPEEGLAE